MKHRRSPSRGIELFAEHEQAKRERAALEDAVQQKSYEFKKPRIARREQATGWAVETLLDWLEDNSVLDYDLEYQGADLFCVATSDIGDINVTMLTPYQTSGRVHAICEPWLVRAEIGGQPSVATAWIVDVDHLGSVLLSTISEGKRAVLVTPRARTGFFSFLHGGAAGLYRRQVWFALDRAVELARLPAESMREAMWAASRESADSFGRRRWVKIRRTSTNRHLRTDEAVAVVSGLWSCGFFETITASRGNPSRWASATVVEDATRDIESAPISYDGRIQARSKGWGIIMDVDIFRISRPLAAMSEAFTTPSSWAVAHLSVDKRPSFEAFRLSEIPGLVGACFWMSGEDLLDGAFAKRVEQLVKEAFAGHQGPYR